MSDHPMCTTCGGPLFPMGWLGRLFYHRCRNCGATESGYTPEEES
jgi:hypothetical protein